MSPPLGLYVHLPWCVRKCPYCDFKSFQAQGQIAEHQYIEALMRDLSLEARYVRDRMIETIFIGGGTPSLFSGNAISKLIAGISERVELAEAVEITLEANPGAIDSDHFQAYHEAGVNRLSIGVQSFRDWQLQRLGRIHKAHDAERAIETARGAGFDNVNLDLMYGLPGDEPGDSVHDLSCAVAFEIEHISWYQLTIEPGTAFGHRPPPLPEDDFVIADYDTGCSVLNTAGFGQYEISAYARDGRESRHNLNYWRFGDYIGVGAGAHSKLTADGGVYRNVKRKHPLSYVSTAGSAAGISETHRLSESELSCEFMLNALRLRNGFEASLFERRTGLPLGSISRPLEQAAEHGWLTQNSGRIIPTETGFRFLNDLQMLFV